MIKSIAHATRNENGVEELAIERELGTLEYLTAAIKAQTFNIPTVITEVWEMRNGMWADKVTGDIPDDEKQINLNHAKAELARQSRLMDSNR